VRTNNSGRDPRGGWLLRSLPSGQGAAHFIGFVLVGVSGLLVNTAALAAATEGLGLHYLVSAAVATVCSTLWNFSLTEFWVFRDRPQRGARWWRLARFFLMNQAALLVRGPIIYLLTARLGLHYLLSNLVSMGAVTVLRYALADRWIWIRPEEAATRTHRYSIHEVVTIVSDVALPELELLRVEHEIPAPTIRVRVGLLPPGRNLSGTAARRTDYSELFGPLGFQVRIETGERVDVAASPLLRLSPHVLYTNVVEPILRWVFAEKGWALVHGACLALDDRAYLVTARTDTGKTTTLLQILSHDRGAAFVADDLTLVSPDGQVLTYPKPLTISSHTVQAINATTLSLLERLTLPIQSRIHSRSGRQVAHQLAQSRLPMATVNAVVQWLVPPPKFTVRQLVPNVLMAGSARLAGLFVIERDDPAITALPEAEAFETLMRNCEDAYGFPPYAAIESFLTRSGELRALERDVVRRALRGVPAARVRSRSGWWQPVLERARANREAASRTAGQPEPAGAAAGMG
jgi:putative flippase GtrA